MESAGFAEVHNGANTFVDCKLQQTKVNPFARSMLTLLTMLTKYMIDIINVICIFTTLS